MCQSAKSVKFDTLVDTARLLSNSFDNCDKEDSNEFHVRCCKRPGHKEYFCRKKKADIAKKVKKSIISISRMDQKCNLLQVSFKGSPG